jgi:hypothetical protein
MALYGWSEDYQKVIEFSFNLESWCTVLKSGQFGQYKMYNIVRAQLLSSVIDGSGLMLGRRLGYVYRC